LRIKHSLKYWIHSRTEPEDDWSSQQTAAIEVSA
jgi:hypothetical protein